MKFKIETGQQRAKPALYWLYYKQKKLTWKVKFDSSCKYDLNNPNQTDENKLIGIGYLPPFSEMKKAWKTGGFKNLKALLKNCHHKYSARFAWRYVADKDAIDLFAYVYDNGKNNVALEEIYIGTAQIDQEVYLSLEITDDSYIFKMLDKYGATQTVKAVTKTHKLKWGFRLNFFFGGDEVAPHTIYANITRIRLYQPAL